MKIDNNRVDVENMNSIEMHLRGRIQNFHISIIFKILNSSFNLFTNNIFLLSSI